MINKIILIIIITYYNFIFFILFNIVFLKHSPFFSCAVYRVFVMVICTLLSCCSFTFPTLFLFAAIAIVILLLGTACSAALCRYATRRWLDLARTHIHTQAHLEAFGKKRCGAQVSQM